MVIIRLLNVILFICTAKDLHEKPMQKGGKEEQNLGVWEEAAWEEREKEEYKWKLH